MVRHDKRKTVKNVNETLIKAALLKVKSGKASIRQAAKVALVHEKSLRNRIMTERREMWLNQYS